MKSKKEKCENCGKAASKTISAYRAKYCKNCVEALVDANENYRILMGKIRVLALTNEWKVRH